jgi:general secretion pathway protein G
MNTDQLMPSVTQSGMQWLRRRLARRTTRAALRGQRGMTLLEILIVLAILGLVMGVLVGPRLYAMFSEGQEKVAKTEVQKFTTEAYIRWQMKNPGQGCPESLNDLASLLDKKEAKDPWNHDYIMLCGDNAPPGSKGFAVMSMGADGQQGTEDDIKSWDE